MLGVTSEGDLVKIDLERPYPRKSLCFVLLEAGDPLDVPREITSLLLKPVRTEHRGLDVYCQGVLHIYLRHYRNHYRYKQTARTSKTCSNSSVCMAIHSPILGEY